MSIELVVDELQFMQQKRRAAQLLYEWQRHGATHFMSRLYQLISTADVQNKSRIGQAFPIELAIWEEWQTTEDEAEFFKKYDLL